MVLGELQTFRRNQMTVQYIVLEPLGITIYPLFKALIGILL
jgi:hypothetical protein